MANNQRMPRGCATGCIYAAVALFIVLLVVMIFVVGYRFSRPMQPGGLGFAPPPAATAPA